jgi:hypothetical protein
MVFCEETCGHIGHVYATMRELVYRLRGRMLDRNEAFVFPIPLPIPLYSRTDFRQGFIAEEEELERSPCSTGHTFQRHICEQLHCHRSQCFTSYPKQFFIVSVHSLRMKAASWRTNFMGFMIVRLLSCDGADDALFLVFDVLHYISSSLLDTCTRSQ